MPFIWALRMEAISPPDDSKQIPQFQSTWHCVDCGPRLHRRQCDGYGDAEDVCNDHNGRNCRVPVRKHLHRVVICKQNSAQIYKKWSCRSSKKQKEMERKIK
jgi:hypothetical protein